MLNENIMVIVAICGSLIGVVGVMFGLFPYLDKKKINTEKILDTTDKTLEATEPIIGVAKAIFPDNPVVNIVSFIENRAVKAVKYAEQLYHSGKLGAAERNQAAKDSVYAALAEFKIVPNDNQCKLINDAIEAAVNDLGHTPADIKTLQDTISNQTIEKAQLQNTIQQLQTNQQTVQTENEQLKQKLVAVQNVVQSNQQTGTQPTA